MPKFIRIGPWSYYRKTKDDKKTKSEGNVLDHVPI